VSDTPRQLDVHSKPIPPNLRESRQPCNENEMIKRPERFRGKQAPFSRQELAGGPTGKAAS